MNKSKLGLIFCTFCLLLGYSCTKSDYFQRKWERDQSNDVYKTLYRDGRISKSDFINLISFSPTITQFRNKTYEEVIRFVNTKAKLVPQRKKLCLDETVCLTISDDFDQDEEEVLIQLYFENIGHRKIKIDSAFISFQLSSFNLPSYFGFSNFFLSEVEPGNKVINQIELRNTLFKETFDKYVKIDDYNFYIDSFFYETI